MGFINREVELSKLQDLWNEESSQLVVVYGKRRVGKTELIKKFLTDVNGFYFLSDKRTTKEQLVEFSRVMGDHFNDKFVQEKGFSDWIEAFRYLKEKSNGKRIAVAIDEYPYLAETDSTTSSVFQKIWDEYLKDSKVYLILCGSSMSMMESELLAYKAPLYGRATGKLLIEPMDLEASMKFLPGKEFEKFLSFYCVTGGMPAYLQHFARFNSITKAVDNLCWDKQGLFHDEVNLTLKQELRTPNIYFSILKAIAFGKTRLNEISSSVGASVQLVNKYIDTLERLDLVHREVPVTEDKPHKSRKGIYIISENFVKFWFRYVYAFSSDLEIGLKKQAKGKFKEQFNAFKSYVYEQVARDDLRRIQDKLFPMERVGRYWDKKVEIDGVALNSEMKQIAFMEAKWSNSKMGLRELNQLIEKAGHVRWNKGDRNEYFVLYSKSGFRRKLLEKTSDDKKIVLIEKIGNK
ncbi:AAA family ATPase [Candidatus Dojkabacteria bacterium]|nr:AAA family ATPase [Candidatus Dojkabacteria bacterium]